MSECDFDLDDVLTMEVVAEIVGARQSMILRLAQQGLIETLESESGERLVSRRTLMRLRRMQRLHRDLGVNFAGAAVIIDLVDRIEEIKRTPRH
jgi:chaperone modulatory protein CbpM